MANIEKIIALADAIEAAAKADATPAIGFNMSSYVAEGTLYDRTNHDCKTVCCIAGWAVFVEHGLDGLQKCDIASCVSVEAQDILGLTDTQARDMFIPSLGVPYHAVRPRHAVAMLRKFAKTGAVVWPAAVAVRPFVNPEI